MEERVVTIYRRKDYSTLEWIRISIRLAWYYGKYSIMVGGLMSAGCVLLAIFIMR